MIINCNDWNWSNLGLSTISRAALDNIKKTQQQFPYCAGDN